MTKQKKELAKRIVEREKEMEERRKFIVGGLAEFRGFLTRIVEVNETDEGIWYELAPAWFTGLDMTREAPLEALKEVEAVNVGFNGNDETQFEPDSYADLLELWEGFCGENGIDKNNVDYVEVAHVG